MVNLKIDSKTVQVPTGTTILDAAKSVQIKIPTLCHHPDLDPTAACGICIVKANGRMVRLFVSDIPLLGRTAAGSYLVRPDEGDIVAGVSVIHKDSADAEASNVPLSKPEEAEGTLPFDLDTDDLEQTPSSPEEEE